MGLRYLMHRSLIFVVICVILSFFACIAPVCAGEDPTPRNGFPPIEINPDVTMKGDILKNNAVILSLSFDLKHSGLDYPTDKNINPTSISGNKVYTYGIVVSNDGFSPSKPTILSIFYGNGTHTTCAHEPFCYSQNMILGNVSVGVINPGDPLVIYQDLQIPTNVVTENGLIIAEIPTDGVYSEQDEKMSYGQMNVSVHNAATIKNPGKDPIQLKKPSGT